MGMPAVLIVLLAITILEFSVWTRAGWLVRVPLAVLLAASLVGTGSWLFAVHPRVWTGLLAVFCYYRAFNLTRIIKARMHERYLHQATRRTGLVLVVCQVATLVLFELATMNHVGDRSRWAVLAGLQLLLVLVLFLSTLRHLRTTREPVVAKSYADRDLPTLTVAIPARNETDDLQACLASLVASDYPKLEIVVLDDCSSNQKTPEIIRDFAHDGVRFVSGSEPSDTWLAKNWAYTTLAEEANGQLLLFCGVDTRFVPGALRHLVTTLLEKNKSMLSILPHNEPTTWKSMFIQPVRYAWELSLPRRLFQRPPVLSTCWLIKADLLKSSGGFPAVSRSIVPESHFARTAAVHDGYSFVRSNDVASVKSYSEQRATAVRTRYPQLHRRPELVALVALAELLAFIAPYALFVAGLLQGWWVACLLSFISLLGVTFIYAAVVQLTFRRFITGSLVLLPFVVLFDIVLLHTSMYSYEYSEVIWKGRNICIPVMHVTPHLPKA